MQLSPAANVTICNYCGGYFVDPAEIVKYCLDCFRPITKTVHMKPPGSTEHQPKGTQNATITAG